jgi:hypothetical protein
MSYTLDSVIELLGDEAQVVGGSVLVREEGRNLEVSTQKNGSFVVTDEGLQYLDALVAEKQAKKAGKSGKGGKVSAPIEVPDLTGGEEPVGE